MTESPDSARIACAEPEEERLFARISWRLLPFLFLLFSAAYLDRVNIGFAKLQMSADLGFSDTVYGFGAGIFFLGYFLFEVPSNLILHRVGARLWIARIVALWGVLSAATLWIETPSSFYFLRFLLGVGEAGLVPGVLYYLTLWYPADRQARVVAMFMAAIPVSGVFGGPLSGLVMSGFDGAWGLRGWQWLFLVEGLPAILLGIATLFILDDGPERARWLTAEEKSWLARRLANPGETRNHAAFGEALRSPAVWGFAGVYFLLVNGLYGITFWMPQLLHDLDQGSFTATGWLTALPNAAASIGMILVARHSDRTGERRYHFACCALAGAAGYLILATMGVGSLGWSLAALALAETGVIACLGVFWPMPSGLLAGRAAAGGLALINAVGALGGYASPAALGWLKDATAQMSSGLFVVAAVLAAASWLCLRITRQREALTISVDARAPAKPATGTPCNGCGACCAIRTCPLARLRFRQLRGPCPALRWDEDGMLYRCGLLLSPEGHLPFLPVSLAGKLTARWIAAGIGCDSTIQIEEP